MITNITYALHWHQKQRNAHQADDLMLAPEGYQEAIYKFLSIAEEHGILLEELGCQCPEDVDKLKEIDVGPFVLRLLRSDEWYASGVKYTDEEELNGELEFRLENRQAPDVSYRTIRLVELRYMDDPDR